jgi:hypothetical protein
MARFRKMRSRSRSFGKRYSRAGNSKGSTNVITLALAGAVYGVARPYVSKLIPDSVSNFAGGNGDELILGTLGYFMAKGKLGSNSMMKDAGKAILVIESARIASGLMSGVTSSTPTYGGNY